jgi:YqaJ-like viral recombinase domain
MNLEIFECEQNSPEWIKARLGIVTASEFKSVMAKGEGKTRRKYMLTVVGEKLSGQPFERYSNDYMERGHLQEDEARNLYTFMTDNEVRRVGFLKRGPVGYSPDGLIGDDGLLEIKTKMAHLHLECLLADELPTEHRQQCQGGLWVSGRQWLDFCSYSPGLPLFVKRVVRDEAYIVRIKVEVDAFLEEMAALEQKIGGYRRAA